MKKVINVLLTVLLCIAVFVSTVTFSIGLPIYVRPFYYLQIDTLNIPANTGYTKEEIKASYNEVLDYLTLSDEFGTGVFKYSESGKSHFEDCKYLFNLNFWGFIISAVTAGLLLSLDKIRLIRLCRIKRIGPVALSGIITLSVIGLLSGIIIHNFDNAFKIFHSVFFKGKDNWLFNRYEDEIILALPEEFFARCAILIGVSIFVISAVLIVVGIFTGSRNNIKTKKSLD